MSYILTREMVEKVTAPQVVFGTTDSLPDMKDIPKQFFEDFNPYAIFVSRLFYGEPLPSWGVTMKAPFKVEDGAVIMKFLRAHLCSFEPKHERKIAGMAYALSFTCTFHTE